MLKSDNISMNAFKAVKIIAPPIKTGQSKIKPESINNKPDPGMSNTFSKTTTPEKAIGKVVATDVINSGRAFFNPCFNNIPLSPNPFAYAVLI